MFIPAWLLIVLLLLCCAGGRSRPAISDEERAPLRWTGTPRPKHPDPKHPSRWNWKTRSYD